MATLDCTPDPANFPWFGAFTGDCDIGLHAKRGGSGRLEGCPGAAVGPPLQGRHPNRRGQHGGRRPADHGRVHPRRALRQLRPGAAQTTGPAGLGEVQGAVPDAGALGGALLPLHANFAPDRDLFIKEPG